MRGGFLSSELAGLHFVGRTLARVWLWSAILQGQWYRHFRAGITAVGFCNGDWRCGLQRPGLFAYGMFDVK